eukprot:3126427-Alexandrium_andersonii.AAC.1
MTVRNAGLKRAEAFGEDSLPPEQAKYTASTVAACLMPLFLKAVYRLEEPICWRGSFIQELCKGERRCYVV